MFLVVLLKIEGLRVETTFKYEAFHYLKCTTQLIFFFFTLPQLAQEMLPFIPWNSSILTLFLPQINFQGVSPTHSVPLLKVNIVFSASLYMY